MPSRFAARTWLPSVFLSTRVITFFSRVAGAAYEANARPSIDTGRTARNPRRPVSPWSDDRCRATRRECRRLERKYRRTKDVVDRAAWVAAVRRKHVDFLQRKNEYWTERIEGERHHPSKLWRSMNTVLHRTKQQGDLQAPRQQGRVSQSWHRGASTSRGKSGNDGIILWFQTMYSR